MRHDDPIVLSDGGYGKVMHSTFSKCNVGLHGATCVANICSSSPGKYQVIDVDGITSDVSIIIF